MFKLGTLKKGTKDMGKFKVDNGWDESPMPKKMVKVAEREARDTLSSKRTRYERVKRVANEMLAIGIHLVEIDNDGRPIQKASVIKERGDLKRFRGVSDFRLAAKVGDGSALCIVRTLGKDGEVSWKDFRNNHKIRMCYVRVGHAEGIDRWFVANDDDVRGAEQIASGVKLLQPGAIVKIPTLSGDPAVVWRDGASIVDCHVNEFPSVIVAAAASHRTDVEPADACGLAKSQVESSSGDADCAGEERDAKEVKSILNWFADGVEQAGRLGLSVREMLELVDAGDMSDRRFSVAALLDAKVVNGKPSGGVRADSAEDGLRAFVGNCCDMSDPQAVQPSQQLLDAYGTYCAANGFRKFGPQQLAQRLPEMFRCVRERRAKNAVYIGIKLKGSA